MATVCHESDMELNVAVKVPAGWIEETELPITPPSMRGTLLTRLPPIASPPPYPLAWESTQQLSVEVVIDTEGVTDSPMFVAMLSGSIDCFTPV
jgi:hypothetical protein